MIVKIELFNIVDLSRSAQGAQGRARGRPADIGQDPDALFRTAVPQMASAQPLSDHHQAPASWKLMESATRGYQVVQALVFPLIGKGFYE